MKRAQVYKKIRSNNAVLNNINRNIVTPEIVFNQLWLPNDEATTVELVELNSSNLEVSPEENFNFSHAWSYVNNDRFQETEQEYKVNTRARERRRLQNQRKNESSNLNASTDYEDIFITDYVYRDLQGRDSENAENVVINHQNMNCFTIINKHFEMESESSSEGRRETERCQYDYNIPDLDCEDSTRSYDEEIITFEAEPDPDKRTIWIYSFKNKRLLSENDFELLNISSKDASSTSSPENIEEIKTGTRKVDTGTCRVATPIPPIYVPKLNLSMPPALPTVTEITEPNKQTSSSNTEKSPRRPISHQPKNNWFKTESTDRREKSSDIINWMALSPRERRRRSINTNINSQYPTKLETVPEKSPTTETNLNKLQQVDDESKVMTKVQADVHNNTVKLDSNRTQRYDTRSIRGTAIDDSKIEKETTESTVDENAMERGDYFKCARKPQIRLNAKPIPNTFSITDPIEKLDSNNWITDEKELKSMNRGSDGLESEINSDEEKTLACKRLWAKNMSLLKPVEWAEYLPIAATPPSLHLSIDLEEKESCFRRVAKFFKCCK